MSASIEHMTTKALLERVGQRWAALLRRANAREAAARRALAHARTVESAQRGELAVLHERARGLEQIVFDYALHRRGVRGGTVAPQIPAPAPRVPAPAPAASFDPAALVAAMLPLGEPDQDEPDVAHALSQLRATGQPQAQVRTPVLRTPAPMLVEAPHTDLPPAEEDAEDHADGYWFPRALRRLAAEDPREAGRLLLQLLPAQGLVWPEDLAYTLNIAETGFVAVTVSGDKTTVQPLLSLDLAQPPALRTDLAGLARAVTARRGWGRLGARVSGTHGTLRPLRALARAPLSLRDLERQGVQLDPALLARLRELDDAEAAPVGVAVAA